MIQRMKNLRLFFLFFFALITCKLAYEQLYHAALLTGSISENHPFMLWLSHFLGLVPQ